MFWSSCLSKKSGTQPSKIKSLNLPRHFLATQNSGNNFKLYSRLHCINCSSTFMMILMLFEGSSLMNWYGGKQNKSFYRNFSFSALSFRLKQRSPRSSHAYNINLSYERLLPIHVTSLYLWSFLAELNYLISLKFFLKVLLFLLM